MSTVEKLSIALTPQLAAKAREMVESGDYATTSEVMREALRQLVARREAHAQLKAEIDKAWDGPFGPPRSREEIRAAGMARLAAKKRA